MCVDIHENSTELKPPAETSEEPHPNLFVRGLPFDWSEQDLVTLFGTYGTLTSVRLVRHNTKKSSLGYGFVRYERVEDAAKAIHALNETMIGGHMILVKLADSDAGPPVTSTVSGLTPCDSCYVKHVPASYSKEDLVRLFTAFGTVVDVKMYPCLDSFRGYSALIKMDSIQSASKAVDKAHGMRPDGSLHSLIVRYAESATEKKARLGRKDHVAEDDVLSMLVALSDDTLSQKGQRHVHDGHLTGMNMAPTQGQAVHRGMQLPMPSADGGSTVSIATVTNLAPYMDKLWLYEHFAMFGPIILVTSNPVLGSGQIVYSSAASAFRAKHELNNSMHGMHQLCVMATLL